MRLLFPTREAWQIAPQEEAAELLSQINPIDGKYVVNKNSTTIQRVPLPFYDGVVLIAVHDNNWLNNKLIIYYLSNVKELYRLNGTSPPIHEVNAKAPIKLTKDSVIDYLKFFCFFVRGEEGPFYIFENSDDPFLSNEIFEDRKKMIGSILQPATLTHQDKEKRSACTALVWYGNELFFGNFVIESTGMIKMMHDERVTSNLPARIVAPLT